MILEKMDFVDRVKRVQLGMVGTDLDGVLVFSTESEPAQVRYFSDYWASFETCGVLIPREGEGVLVIGPESLTYARSRSKLNELVQVMDFRESSQPDYPGSKHPSWRDILKSKGIGKLGISGWHLFPYAIMMNIMEALGGKDFVVPADAMIQKQMMKKDEKEIACLRRAAKISEYGFRAILERIKPGMTEVELCGIATEAMLSNGAESTGYPIWCCSGPNSNQAISRPSLRKVGTGEVIHFSIGAKVEGYSASIGRPVVLGECPAELRKFLQVGLDAANMTFDVMRHNVLSGTAAKQVHDYVCAHGYGDALLYGPAHGCGQMECEYPFLETSSTYLLEENMTFMQDMFLHRGEVGFRWEDGLLIRREGAAEMLSNYGRQINIIK